MLKRWLGALAPAFLVLVFSPSAGADSHGKAPSTEEMIKRLGYSSEQVEALKQGKIVAIDLERGRSDQLIAAVAARVEAPLAEIAANAKKGMNIQRDPGVIAAGTIPVPANDYGFEKLAYGASDSEEIKRFLAIRPGDTFNLSSEEIVSLQQALEGVKAADAAAGDKVSAAYREVLRGRLKAYLKEGLQGIAPYDHGSNSFSPAEELRAVDQRVEPFLTEYFPAFKQALLDFPKGQSPEVSSQFYWIKREVEGRPAVILAHQLVQESDDFLLMTQRQFFVGHTYDSLQVVALGLPIQGGTAVFYVNTAFTDKITGFFSGVAQSVGQDRMKADLEAYFEGARKDYAQ